MSKLPRIFFRSRPRSARAATAAEQRVPFAATAEELVVEGVMTPRDEAIFLLQTAAEIEHSLLVQYLYTAYSIDVGNAPDETERTKARGWQSAIVEIAIEEMAHLISMQNLLISLGGPTNLDREDFPFRDLFYPFHFKLEPISLDSLAKYVVTEMPEIAPDAELQAIIGQAMGAQGGEPLNRVGALFEKIDELLDELSDSDFYADSADTVQAIAGEWRALGGRIVQTVSNREEARELANAIAEQGEGGDAAVTSHYQKFRTIYEEFASTTTWNPSHPTPNNPNTSEEVFSDAEMENGRITDQESRRWAHVADLQYRLLLYAIAHSVTLDRTSQLTQRGTVINWCFLGMKTPGLMGVISHLQSRPQHDPPQVDADGREKKAGPPFALPYTLSLPQSIEAQWRTYLDIVDATDSVLKDTTTAAPLRNTLERTNDLIRSAANDFIDNLPTDTPVNPPDQPPAPSDGTKAKADFVELLKSKCSLAQIVHSGVQVGDDGGNLSGLFSDEAYERILQFLTTANATRPPAAGKPLVVPGNPSQSGFYIQITDGIMAANFTDEEAKVVERWIRSLPTDSGGAASGRTVALGMRAAAGAQGGAAGSIVAKRFASGLDQPLFLTSAPGKPDAVYLVEKTGAIKVLNASDGMVTHTLFQVDDLSVDGERGLLGLAFHPKFQENGHFYVNCTDHAGRTTVRRYTATANGVDPASRHNVMVVDQPFANHNGGWIGFGPNDGFLYIALGDGGSANDPTPPIGNAQNKNSLLGKMLRVDVDKDDLPAAADMNYGIPSSNPFASGAAARGEIWATGLRNPWRCSFDQMTGDLWIADVGQFAVEEINFQNTNSRGGENYGWRIREGTVLTGLDSDQPNLVDPIFQYGRSDGGTIIGGHVYRGEALAGLQGTYFYADFLSSRIWSFRFDGTSISNHMERTAEINVGGPISSIVSFGQDSQGEIYIVSILGDIFRISST